MHFIRCHRKLCCFKKIRRDVMLEHVFKQRGEPETAGGPVSILAPLNTYWSPSSYPAVFWILMLISGRRFLCSSSEHSLCDASIFARKGGGLPPCIHSLLGKCILIQSSLLLEVVHPKRIVLFFSGGGCFIRAVRRCSRSPVS